jgi:hypothetical protein
MGRNFRTRMSWRTGRRISIRVPAALRSAESGRIETSDLVPRTTTKQDLNPKRFMTENASVFGKDVKFSFERKIAAPMNKMMIGRLGSRVQSTLDSFFRLVNPFI